MKILLRHQIREADAYTIAHEPIASHALMERAGRAAAHRLLDLIPPEAPILILCGMGNNGGDGLVIADVLERAKREVAVRVFQHAAQPSADHAFHAKLVRWKFFSSFEDLQEDFSPNTYIIDALLGSGQDRPLAGALLHLVQALNAMPHPVIAIDVPTGLFTDGNDNQPATCLHCIHTLSFQFPKLGFLLPPDGAATQSFELLDIGLHPAFVDRVETPYYFTDQAALQPLVRRRDTFSHKGDYGHVFLLAGSMGMAGAAVLAAGGALRSGCGKLTVFSSESVSGALLQHWPEAMFSSEERVPEWTDDEVLVAGPGWGRSQEQQQKLAKWLASNHKPCVLDADALYHLADNPDWWNFIPAGSILTPHPGEFYRLTRQKFEGLAGLRSAQNLAVQHSVVLVVKGAYTAVCCPNGAVHFNASGNPAMAKGGSGDVLSGMIGALLAQGYAPEDAARLGVYLHGRAGDISKQQQSLISVVASDLISCIGEAYRELVK